MIKVVILDINVDRLEKSVRVEKINNDLDTFYEIIGCRTIDIPTRKIGKHYYDIIVDDEGLLKDAPKVSAINNAGDVMLVGNLIVCKHDEEGETIGLNNQEVEEVLNEIRTGINMQTGKPVIVLHVEY